MTKDEIIKLAKNAGLVEWLPNSTFSDGIWWIDAHEVGSELLEFASLVAELEREKCARVCEELETCSDAEFYGHEFSAAIRERKSQ